jgi:hypothetical protein
MRRVADTQSAVRALQTCADTKRVLVVSPEGVDAIALANDLADAGVVQVNLTCVCTCVYVFIRFLKILWKI